MNNKKVKKLRKEYKKTLVPKVDPLQVSEDGTVILKEYPFNKNTWRKIKGEAIAKNLMLKIEKHRKGINGALVKRKGKIEL